MMEDDIGIFSIPYDEIDTFKELLVEYYESNDSEKIKHFFSSCTIKHLCKVIILLHLLTIFL